MSVVMDSQDLCGYLRGICLIAVVKETGRSIAKEDIYNVIGRKYAGEITCAVDEIANFTGINRLKLSDSVSELLQADEGFLQLENLNLQLGLLSARPIPIFPFLSMSAADHVALHCPFINVARNLLHAAIRLRMQLFPSTQPDVFWRVIGNFLWRVGGNDDLSAAIAVSTIADVVSDIKFSNFDVSARVCDEVLARRIDSVLKELTETNLSAIAASLRSGR